MPTAIQLLSAHPRCRGVFVEKGLGNISWELPGAFIAMCQYLFDSIESFIEVFLAHTLGLQEDVPKYIDIEPIIQFKRGAYYLTSMINRKTNFENIREIIVV